MMQRHKIVIEYDGTDFYGWQIQPDRRTVQGNIEDALLKIFGEKVRIHGAGRTDRGVHAYGQVASFDTSCEMGDSELMNALNGNTPEDINIKECIKTSSEFHARFSAKSRVYQYQVYNGKSVFRRRYFYQVKRDLNIESMRPVAKELIGEREFRKFSTKDEGICNLKKIDFREYKEEIFFIIEADHFLRRMVRGIVGLLIHVGIGNLGKREAFEIIEDQRKRTPIVPPSGLFLLKVKY